jgi:RHS repeat-associated protein
VTGRLDYIQSGAGGAIQNWSYAWDQVGNLTQRQDLRQGLTESFQYDNLHRLTGVSGPDPLSLTYDARGNALTKSGAVSGGVSHTISWYSYNLPNTISGAPSYSSQFFYDPDRTRYKQVANYGGTAETTSYIGGLVEKVTLGATTHWKHYIAGANGVIAVYTRKSNGTHEIHYLTKDHLGSVDTITDTSGSVEVRLSFASFGQRRNAAGWVGNPTSADWTQITDSTRRGYSGQEMLDNLALIHMNGRVYDALVGQFVSPDPFVPEPLLTQSYNRYSYVRNNPLRFVDPSGFEEEEIKLDGGWGGGGGGSAADSGPRTFWEPNATLFPPERATSWDLGGASFGLSSGVFPWGGTEQAPASDGSLPRTDETPAAPIVVRSPVGSAVDGAKILDTITAPWGGWDDFKYAVRCTWECDMPGNGSLEANLAGLPPILGGVTRAPNLLRPLQASDFGVKSLKALEGSLRVDGSLATVTIRNIEGNLGHYMDALNKLRDTARATGATTLRLEGTVANPTLLRALERVLGPAQRGMPGGAQDYWLITL